MHYVNNNIKKQHLCIKSNSIDTQYPFINYFHFTSYKLIDNTIRMGKIIHVNQLVFFVFIYIQSIIRMFHKHEE